MKSSSLRRRVKTADTAGTGAAAARAAAPKAMSPSLTPHLLILVPARWMEMAGEERNWIADVIREASLKWRNVCVAFDPGFPGQKRSGISFAERAFNDFKESVKEVFFDHCVSAVIAVGEAANAHNMSLVMGWSPMVRKASIFLAPDLARQDVKNVSELSDVVIHHAPGWNVAGQSWGKRVCLVNSPDQVVDVLRERLSLIDTYAPGACDLGAEGLSVVLGGAGLVRRDLGFLKGLGIPVEILEAKNTPSDPRRTPVCALNNALRRSRYRYVLYLCRATTREGLGRVMTYLRNDPMMAIVGGAPLERAAVPTNGSKTPGLVNGGHEIKEFSKSIPAPASGWMIRRGAMARVGFPDEGFQTISFAMYDYCLRIRQMGLRVYTALEVPFFPNGGGAASRVARPENGGSGIKSDAALLLTKWAMTGPQLKMLFARN